MYRCLPYGIDQSVRVPVHSSEKIGSLIMDVVHLKSGPWNMSLIIYF
jgi:hypothetical protein